jgi:hypothetical protein
MFREIADAMRKTKGNYEKSGALIGAKTIANDPSMEEDAGQALKEASRWNPTGLTAPTNCSICLAEVLSIRIGF